ncbi:HAD-IIA family hydrolase [Halegenticoccus tardaugens]|uniref:HAD-IIA family hydrolase n=1 Tax=Halegenticoccus tardaugens TaxID=2071624 RepID=UPI00100AAE3F|nr:HAD-IIA family hydrolase [Halegenticoccus tardaugens]
MNHRGVVLDVDGTVVMGDEPIPGAAEGLAALSDAGMRRLFVSNNPTKPPVAYVDRLARAGFDVAAEEVMTSGTVTTAYLRETYPDGTLFLVGESGLREQFLDAGLSVVRDPTATEPIDAAVVSIDRRFDYERLTDALSVLSDESVAFVGTDPDVTIPTADGLIPGSGAIINAVSGVTGRSPDCVLGKPSAVAQRMALDRLGLAPEECLVVGDRLDTDVALGERAGMTTALVRTGVTDEGALTDAAVEPDYVLDSLADVERIIGEG